MQPVFEKTSERRFYRIGLGVAESVLRHQASPLAVLPSATLVRTHSPNYLSGRSACSMPSSRQPNSGSAFPTHAAKSSPLPGQYLPEQYLSKGINRSCRTILPLLHPPTVNIGLLASHRPSRTTSPHPFRTLPHDFPRTPLCSRCRCERSRGRHTETVGRCCLF